MEYTLWEGGWKRQLNQLLNNCARDLARALLTINHLAREGPFSQPEDQAEILHRPVLEDI